MIYDVRVELPDNAYELTDEPRATLTVAHNGRILEVYHDINFSDARFSGDLSWIAPALRKAYDLGKEDGEVTLREIDKDRGT